MIYAEKILYKKLLYTAIIADRKFLLYVSHVKNIIKIFIVPSMSTAVVIHSNF